MKNKTVAMLGAGVVGVLAAIGLSHGMPTSSSENTGAASVEIFVSVRTIDVAEPITPDKVRLEKWPVDRVPKGAGSKLSDFEGKFARQRFYEGEPIMPVKLMDDATDTADAIPHGYRVVSISLDAQRGVNDRLRRGGLVDVIAYFKKGDRFSEPTAKTVLNGVRIFAVDDASDESLSANNDGVQLSRAISLLIHRQDAAAWTCASELGTIRLALASPTEIDDRAEFAGASPAAEEFLAWLSEQQPLRELHEPELLQTAAMSSVPVLVSTPAPAVVPAPVTQERGISIANPLRQNARRSY